MPNTAAPFGFRQYFGHRGAAPTFEQRPYKIAYDYATKIYRGDPVVYDAAAGTIVQGAAAGVAGIAGIFMGCEYNAIARNGQLWHSPFWPGVGQAVAGTPVAWVIDNSGSLWEVQTGLTGLVQGNVGENINFIPGTGSDFTGESGAYLDVSTLGVTTTLPFKVVDLKTTPPGENGTMAGAYNVVIVAPNNWHSRNLTGTA